MSKSNGPNLSLNVFIDKQKSKVLFAEANSDFADVLLGFLTLPLGKIVKILQKRYGKQAPAVGSLTSLYRGLFNLDVNQYFCVGGAKQILLNPRSSFEDECRKLILDISDSQPNQYFACQNSKCDFREIENISLYSDIAACCCGRLLNSEIHVAERLAVASDGGVFTINASPFIIYDDLRVVPNVSGFLQTLHNLGITDTHGSEMRRLSFGIDDIVDLLKFSLTSSTPLSDVIFKNSSRQMVTPKPGILLHCDEKAAVSNNSKKMILKMYLRKSTHKFLFAQATNEFVEFLFSLLSVPLGGVEYLLGGNSCIKNIDNLYRSVKDVIDNKYFRVPKSRLINPKLPHGCVSQNQFIPLATEETPPKLYYKSRCYNEIGGILVSSFKLRQGQGNYVKEQAVFIVSDDLTVSPFTIASSISFLDGLGIPLSDVQETELNIGLEEALCILKASLWSTTALTDALVIPMLSKLSKLQHQPKEEYC